MKKYTIFLMFLSFYSLIGTFNINLGGITVPKDIEIVPEYRKKLVKNIDNLYDTYQPSSYTMLPDVARFMGASIAVTGVLFLVPTRKVPKNILGIIINGGIGTIGYRTINTRTTLPQRFAQQQEQWNEIKDNINDYRFLKYYQNNRIFFKDNMELLEKK